MIIKVLLVGAVLGLALMLLRGRRRAAGQAAVRMAGLGLVVLACVAIVYPGTTVWAAHVVGVGRGTDLVLYVLVMTYLFSAVATYQRFHALEAQVATLTRELALQRPTVPQVPAAPVREVAPRGPTGVSPR